MQLSPPSRFNRRAIYQRYQVLRSAGFEVSDLHGVWFHKSRRKIIAEAVISTINLTQLVCWIKRPTADQEWSAWFTRPLRRALLDAVIRDCMVTARDVLESESENPSEAVSPPADADTSTGLLLQLNFLPSLN